MDIKEKDDVAATERRRDYLIKRLEQLYAQTGLDTDEEHHVARHWVIWRLEAGASDAELTATLAQCKADLS